MPQMDVGGDKSRQQGLSATCDNASPGGRANSAADLLDLSPGDRYRSRSQHPVPIEHPDIPDYARLASRQNRSTGHQQERDLQLDNDPHLVLLDTVIPQKLRSEE